MRLAGRSWSALLVGATLAVSRADLPAAPEELPPAGFIREDLKEIRAVVLRPEKWLFRRSPTVVPIDQCTPRPFTGEREFASGVQILLIRGMNDQPAEKYAAARIAQCAERCHVLRGWTKKGVPAEPFTTSGFVDVMQNDGTDGVEWTCEIVFVANRATNMVYLCSLQAPVGQWKEVESWGEAMLAGLRFDPKF